VSRESDVPESLTRGRAAATVTPMRCANCDAELLPGKPFCHVCGTRVARACERCGSPVEAGFRFCPECGAPVAADPPAAATDGIAPAASASPAGAVAARHAASPPPASPRLADLPPTLAEKIRASRRTIAGERKLVTVLFCDLVGSTALAERLDPEEYRELLEQYLAVVFDEVYRVEGIVTQLAGDGAMALFGAPVAHEDAPYRAVHAALAVRDRLAALGARLRAERGLDLRARIGIHTGPVVVGAVGNDLKMDYTAIGDTTNLAARLQAAAEPGMILASEATMRLVRGFFDVRPGRRLTVKGKREPVIAHEVLGLSGTTAPMAIAEARGLTPLVGRREELAQLVSCYERMTGGLPQIVTIVGPAGSGKSRLIYELRQRLAGETAAVFEARCSAMTQHAPYAPWESMLRQHFGLAPGERPRDACAKIRTRLGSAAAELEASLPYLCQVMAVRESGAPPGDLPDDEVKRQTFEAVARLIKVTAERQPVAVVIEDLHWIDEPSREMLELGVGRVQRARVMFLTSHRPDYQPTWRVRAALTQLHLAPLSDAECVEIVRAVAGGTLPPELERRILAQAEGNPFFTEEITRALVEEGYLLRGDGQVRLTRPVAEMRLPGTIEELIGARLDRLGAHAKRVVQVAAVLGRQFRRAHLARLLDGEGIDVAAELASLERRGIIHRKTALSDDEFRFGESLTQEVAYESLLLRQRRELHERIGRLLEAEPGEGGAERSALIAHHLARGNDVARAVEALLRAARDAERVPAFPTAARFYQEAWTLADAARAGAATTLERLALQAAHGVCRMTIIYGAGDRSGLDRTARRGCELAERLGDREVLADLLSLHGMMLSSGERERFAEGHAMAERALAIAREGGHALAATRISRVLAWSYLFAGRLEEASRTIERVIAELEGIEDTARKSDVTLGALFMRDRIRYQRDDLEGALRGALDTLARAVRAGNHTVQSGSSATVALVRLARGEYAEARDLAERSLDIVEAIGNTAQLRPIAAAAIVARRELGEPIPPRLAALLDHDAPVGAEPLNAPLVVEAWLEVDAGEPRRAEEYARLVYATCGGRLREAAGALALADALRHVGGARAAEAERLYAEARDLASAVGARSIVAGADRGLGELAAARGDVAAATRHLEASHALYRALGFQRSADAVAGARAALDAGARRTAS
jgi:class 3 adenylate cyclase/tetratricopeptide (TPR) repeat protein